MSLPRGPVLDARQVRRAFSRASGGYASAAALQREVEARLLESLDFLATVPGRDRRWSPGVVLDVGSGSGWSTALLAHLVGPGGSVLGVELDLPTALADQLSDDGVLVAPVADQLWTVRRRGDDLSIRRSGAYRFVPLIPPRP